MSKNTIRTHGNPISGQKDGKKAHTDLTPSYLSSKKIELLGKVVVAGRLNHVRRQIFHAALAM